MSKFIYNLDIPLAVTIASAATGTLDLLDASKSGRVTVPPLTPIFALHCWTDGLKNCFVCPLNSDESWILLSYSPEMILLRIDANTGRILHSSLGPALTTYWFDSIHQVPFLFDVAVDNIPAAVATRAPPVTFIWYIIPTIPIGCNTVCLPTETTTMAPTPAPCSFRSFCVSLSSFLLVFAVPNVSAPLLNA